MPPEEVMAETILGLRGSRRRPSTWGCTAPNKGETRRILQ